MEEISWDFKDADLDSAVCFRYNEKNRQQMRELTGFEGFYDCGGGP